MVSAILWPLSGLPGFPCGLGGSLLGFLLRRALAGAEKLATDPDGRLESFVMIRTALGDLIVRGIEPIMGCGFLQPSLVIGAAGAKGGLLDSRFELGDHEGSGRIESTIEVDGADDCLGRIGENRRLLTPTGCILSLAEAQPGTETERHTDIGQRTGAHHRSSGLREMPLGQVREEGEEVVGDHQLQDGIAEKLESFVGVLAIVLCTPGPVCQRMGEESGIVEAIPEPILEGRRKRSRDQRSAQLGDDVLDGVTHCAKIFEVLVFDPEADGSLGQLFFDRFDEFDQGK